jgi:putative hydrolase of the HAD superfamily
VCFDVANVLVEIDIAYAIAHFSLPVDPRLSQKIQALGLWETYDAFERGHIRKAQFLRALRAHLDVDLDNTALVAWWNSSLRKMVDGVERVVSEVIGRMPVYALTNTNPLHFDYVMRHMSLLQQFDRVIASFHVGHRKPEAQLFTAAAHLIGQAPADILFIDDLLTNVEGAKAVGYQAALCDRSSTRLHAILVQYGVL